MAETRTGSELPVCASCGAPHASDAGPCPVCGIGSSEVASDPAALGRALATAVAGRFEVGRQIGRGLSGLVFEARNIETGRRCALKVGWRSATAHRRMKREAAVTSRLTHDHILPILSHHLVGQGLLATEVPLLTGRTVSDLIDERPPLPFDRVVVLLREVAAALDFAHARGVVHGALRPGKILLDVEGHCRLADFSWQLDEEPEHADTAPRELGWGAYMPYEQRHDLRSVDGRVDQFAIAVIAYELLIGRRLSRANAEHLLEIEPMDVVPTRPIRPDVPLSANIAIRRATTKEPSMRYATVGEFVEALSHARVEEARGPRTFGPQSRLKRRSMMWALVPAAALATIFSATHEPTRLRLQQWYLGVLGNDLRTPDLVSFGIKTNGENDDRSTGPRLSSAPARDERVTNTTTDTRTRVGEQTGQTPPGTTIRRREGSPTTVEADRPAPAPPQRRVGVDVGEAPGRSTATSAATPQTGDEGAPARRDASLSQAPGGNLAPQDSAAAAQAARGPGYIEVSLDQGTAIVVIDGVPRGRTPLLWRGGPGEHSVRLLGLGRYSPASQPVRVTPGDTARAAFFPRP